MRPLLAGQASVQVETQVGCVLHVKCKRPGPCVQHVAAVLLQYVWSLLHVLLWPAGLVGLVGAGLVSPVC